MKKFILLFLMFFMFAVAFAAEYSMPRAFLTPTNEVPWWMKAQRKEKVTLIDHLGHTNTAVRVVGSTNTVSVGFKNQGSAKLSADLKVLTYSVPSVNIEEGWSITNICPGVYNLETDKFYIEMTDEEKTARWIDYTNKVHLAEIAEQNVRNAPAKFDVSMTVEEFRASLLGERKYEDLLPIERREISLQVSVYRDEWTRINEPDKWRALPDFRMSSRMTEQQKIKSRRGFRLRK